MIHRVLYNATFVYPTEEKEESSTVIVLSFFQALKRSIFNTPLKSFSHSQNEMKIEDIKDECIVYFIEGTTANGKIVLKPRIQPIEHLTSEEVCLCSIKYDESVNVYYDQSTSFIKYVFGLIGTVKCDVLVTIDKCENVNEETTANFYRNTLKVSTSSFTSSDKVEFVQLAMKKK